VRSWLYAALLMTLWLVSVREARASGSRVVFEPGVCADSAKDASERISRLLRRRGADERGVSVRIERRGDAYQAIVRLQTARGSESETVIAAARCDEAFDAVAVVLALAFGSERATTAPAEAAVAAPPAATSFPAPEARALDISPPLPIWSERSSPAAAATAAQPAERTLRIAVATGADSGTLPASTLFVAGAVARSIAAFELRGVVRYGLPTIDDDAEGGVRQSERSDFGAVELRGCYGVGSRLRLSGCTGTEVGAVRRSRRWQSAGRTEQENALRTRFSGVLAAAVAHRAGLIQPELELAAAAVALGREPRASWLVLRMSVGAALAF
jgi:hypothetical protein